MMLCQYKGHYVNKGESLSFKKKVITALKIIMMDPDKKSDEMFIYQFKFKNKKIDNGR